MTVRRNQPARNPREGVLQNLKKPILVLNISGKYNIPVHVFTGSDLITGSNRIGPDRARIWLFSSFLKNFFIIIMFIKYIYMIIIMMSGSSRSETIATI